MSPTTLIESCTDTSSSQRLRAGDRIPKILTKQELADATGYSIRQIDNFRRSHNHPGIKELAAPGHPRFCGETLQAWIDSGKTEPARRRFFASRAGKASR